MGKVRKHIRNLHDGTEDGERLFDAIAEEGRVTIELKTSKKQLVQVPWEDIVTQVHKPEQLGHLHGLFRPPFRTISPGAF